MLIARKKELQKFASKLGIGLSPEVHLSWDAYFTKVGNVLSIFSCAETFISQSVYFIFFLVALATQGLCLYFKQISNIKYIKIILFYKSAKSV